MTINIPNWAKIPFRVTWNFLRHDKTPLGVTLLLAALAAIGTYYLTPEINKRIQQDNARSAHVLKTIDALNGNIIELSALIRKFNFEVARKRPVQLLEKRDDVLDKIASMQWRVIDASVIVDGVSQRDSVEAFRSALTRLQFAVIKAHQDGRPINKANLEEVSSEGYIILEKLYRLAGLYDAEMRPQPETSKAEATARDD